MAARQQKLQPNPHQISAIRIARMHFYYVFVYALAIVLYDAWKLITPQAVLARWTVSAIMLAVTAVVWYAARANVQNNLFYKALVYIFILLDIYVAAFTVYAERGMASRGVALFAIPLVVSAVLLSRRALFATAALCTAAYSFAAVRYFVVNFNEGYKIELYSVIAFYSAGFFVLAGFLSVLLRNLNSRSQ
jgi:hypothetical protein